MVARPPRLTRRVLGRTQNGNCFLARRDPLPRPPPFKRPRRRPPDVPLFPHAPDTPERTEEIGGAQLRAKRLRYVCRWGNSGRSFGVAAGDEVEGPVAVAREADALGEVAIADGPGHRVQLRGRSQVPAVPRDFASRPAQKVALRRVGAGSEQSGDGAPGAHSGSGVQRCGAVDVGGVQSCARRRARQQIDARRVAARGSVPQGGPLVCVLRGHISSSGE
mmetsp:Transcript_14291/g.47751  ORF Transcript_14291/g.47751 Transcript_14291/m.47751 type:complete len:220 (-) Transcript_14291:2615-3274(-)